MAIVELFLAISRLSKSWVNLPRGPQWSIYWDTFFFLMIVSQLWSIFPLEQRAQFNSRQITFLLCWQQSSQPEATPSLNWDQHLVRVCMGTSFGLLLTTFLAKKLPLLKFLFTTSLSCKVYLATDFKIPNENLQAKNMLLGRGKFKNCLGAWKTAERIMCLAWALTNTKRFTVRS